MKALWFILSVICFGTSYFPFNVGMRKLAYKGFEYKDKFVGGDAYNFIINSTQSTSYFVIGGILIMSAFGFLIAGYLHGLGEQKAKIPQEINTVSKSTSQEDEPKDDNKGEQS